MLHFSRLWNFGCGSVPEGSIVHEKEPSQSFTSHDQSADLPFAGRLGDPPPTLPSWSFTLRSHFRVEVSRISFQYIFMVVLTLVKLATFFFVDFPTFPTLPGGLAWKSLLSGCHGCSRASQPCFPRNSSIPHLPFVGKSKCRSLPSPFAIFTVLDQI